MEITLLYWHWLALGFVLMCVELIVPGFFFMWLGISAMAVSGLLFIMPELPFTLQGALFAVAGILSFYLSRKFFAARQKEMGTNQLNKRGAALIGEIVVLESAILNGHGKAKVGDTLWSVQGPDAPAASRVRITGVNGTQLIVEIVP